MQVQAVNHIKAYTKQASRGDHIHPPGGIPEGIQGKITKRSLDLRLGKLGIEFRTQELDTESLYPKQQRTLAKTSPKFDTEMGLALEQINTINSQSRQEQIFSGNAADSPLQRSQAVKAYAKQQNSQDFNPGFSMFEVLV